MKHILYILLITGLITGCVKENSHEFFPYTNNQLNDTNWYAVPAQNAPVWQLNQSFARHTYTDSVSGDNGGTLIINDSIQLNFPGGFAQTQGGTVINDKMSIEFTHLNEKGDFIRHNIPTMHYDKLLVTGGAIFIKATYNGQEVKMAPGKYVTVKIINKFSATPAANMQVFYGNETANINPVQSFTWEPSYDTLSSNAFVFSTQTGGIVTTGYLFNINRFRWVGIASYLDSSQAHTLLSVVTPPNFTNANTKIYAVFRTDNIVAELTPDHLAKIFYLQNAYIGKEITIVSLSKINDKFYLGHKNIIITGNAGVSIQPVETSKQQIEDFLNFL